MRPLYEITRDYQELMNELSLRDELTLDDIRKLDEIKLNFDEKMQNIASFIKNLEIEHDAVDNAIKNMQTRRDRLKKKIEYLQGYFLQNMEIFGVKRINTPNFEVRIVKNPCSVQIHDVTMLPEKYIINKEVCMTHIDKASIKKDLKENIQVPGAFLSQSARVEIR